MRGLILVYIPVVVIDYECDVCIHGFSLIQFRDILM